MRNAFMLSNNLFMNCCKLRGSSRDKEFQVVFLSTCAKLEVVAEERI